MNGENYILIKQQRWAEREGIEMFIPQKKESMKKYYVKNETDNLFEPLSDKSRIEISKGDGGELIADKDFLTNMHALHSSSALSVNVFQYWKNKDIYKLVHALRLCKRGNKSAKSIAFERKFKIFDNSKTAPNIDVVIYNNENSDIKTLAIECKFKEPNNTTQKGLEKSYFVDIEKQL